MATNLVWEAIFDRGRRRRLLLQLTTDCLRFAVWLHELRQAPENAWFSCLRYLAYNLCLVGWLLSIVAEHAIHICGHREDTLCDAIFVLAAIILELLSLTLSVPLTMFVFGYAGPTIILVAGIEFGISLMESSIDWSMAALLEAIPCELTVVLINDLPNGPVEEIDLFIWYKMDWCLLIVDDEDIPETLLGPYRFPANTPLSDRSKQPPWLLTKVNEILLEEFGVD